MAQDCWGPDYEQLGRERLIRNEAMEHVAGELVEFPRYIIDTLGVDVPYETMSDYITLSLYRSLDLSFLEAIDLTGRVLHGSMSQNLIEFENGTLKTVQQPEV